MARKPKGKPLTLRPVRLDDDVWAECQRLGKENVWGLVANVVSDHALRTGAKVWILGWNGDAENAQVRGVSKSGKVITKYIKLKRLERFRAAWIPEGKRWNSESQLKHSVWPQFQWEDKAHAVDLAAALKKWETVQVFHRDGRLLRKGSPSSTFFKSASE